MKKGWLAIIIVVAAIFVAIEVFSSSSGSDRRGEKWLRVRDGLYFDSDLRNPISRSVLRYSAVEFKNGHYRYFATNTFPGRTSALNWEMIREGDIRDLGFGRFYYTLEIKTIDVSRQETAPREERSEDGRFDGEGQLVMFSQRFFKVLRLPTEQSEAMDAEETRTTIASGGLPFGYFDK